MDQAVISPALISRAQGLGLEPEQMIVGGPPLSTLADPAVAPAGTDFLQAKDFDATKPPGDSTAAAAKRMRLYGQPYDDRRSGGRGDERSATNPDDGWGWLADHGVDIMLTNRSEAAIADLKRRGPRRLGD